MPLDPQEACVFGVRWGNRSAFILDPRLYMSSSSSCPSSCMLAVLAMLWGSSSATSSSQSCSTTFYTVLLLYQNNETLSPGLLGCHTFSGDYPVLLTFYSGYPKHLPNLFNTSWLFRINRGNWANQKRRYILKESNDNDASVLTEVSFKNIKKGA